jgi:hypothetical protein
MASENADFQADPKDYFGTLPAYSSEFAAAALSRCNSWSKNVISNGQQQQWFQNYRLYYNCDPEYTGSNIAFNQSSFSLTSANGDAVYAHFNIFRNIITNILNMTINQPPALDAKAANSEPSSLVASQLFKDVLDFYVNHWKNGRFKKQLRKAVEYCLIMSNGYILIEWDTSSGKPYIKDENDRVIRDGDLYIKARSVWDVFFDVNCEDDDELDWVIVRDYINRHELAARYPDQRDKIMNLPKKTDLEVYRSWGWDDNTDLVAVYKCYWKSSSILPNGRFALVADNDLVLYDGGNPYVDEFDQAIIPILTVRAADGVGTLYGYCPGNDLAPIQVSFNTSWTAILTNLTAFGIQNIWTQQGANLNVEQLQGALNLIETAPGIPKPEALQLTAIPPATFEVAKLLEGMMESVSGMNSVVRGDPESSLKAASGRALGLLQAMAVQFNSGLQDSYQQMLQDSGNLILRILRTFAKTDRVTTIVGKDKTIRMSEWNGELFQKVGTIVAEQVNPMSKTIAGNRDEAEFLVKNHLISTPQEYSTVAQTGRLDPLIMTDQTQLNLIQQENEQLLKGVVPPVMAGDNHKWHIDEHMGLVASPQVRLNSPMLQKVLQHVQYHKDQMANEAQQQGPQPPQMNGPSGGPHMPMPPQPPPAPQQGPTTQRKPGSEAPTAPGPTGAPVPIPKTAHFPQPGV